MAALHTAYLTLEVFLYRAILRPLARSPPPPPIFPEGSNISNLWGPASDLGPSMSSWLLDDLVMGSIEDSDQQVPSVDFSDFGEAAEITLNAAEMCAGIIAKFVANLVPKDFDVLWYSCKCSLLEWPLSLVTAEMATELLQRDTNLLRNGNEFHRSTPGPGAHRAPCGAVQGAPGYVVGGTEEPA